MKMINKILQMGKKKRSDRKDSKHRSPTNAESKQREASKKPSRDAASKAPTIEDLLKPSPSFQDTPQNGRVRLFIDKLRLCSVMFNWDKESTENKTNARAIEVKRQLLLELVEFVGRSKRVFTETVVVQIMKMVQINLFRTLPPKVHAEMIDPEDEEPVFEPAWPHLQIVYEFFLRFIISAELDERLMRKFITGDFVNGLLLLLDSEDPRERDYLKTILHRVYAKFMQLRAFIRKSINTTFYSFIYETESHNGVAELLEILGSIISGFALPLKEEHKRFLFSVLLPMHKVKPLGIFHNQLSYCVTQFVEKDNALAERVIRGLLKFWPTVNSQKELLFLHELEELLELTQDSEFERVITPLFRQISRSISSPHFQIAERTLFLWHNEYITNLIATFRQPILPIIFPALQQISDEHWNQTVNTLALNVLKIFMNMDADLFKECSARHEQQMKQKEENRKVRREQWGALEAKAGAGTTKAGTTAAGAQ